MAIAAEAGKPLSLDSVTEKQRRRGFARVKVEIDSCQPVKPGVVVEAGGARFWQQFQFENLPPVCYLCGLVGHVEHGCAGRPTAQEGGSGGEGLGAVPRMPRLGPWISTSRIRQPRAAPTGVSRRAGPGPGVCPSSGPSSSSPASNPRSSSSPPGSPSDSEGWQKPAKVARRVRVEVQGGGKGGEGEEVRGGAGPRVQAFAPLSVLGDKMELGEVAVAPVECRMVDLEQTLLKRPRSPLAEGKKRQQSGPSITLPASSESSKSSVDLPLLLCSSQGSSPGIFSDSAPHSEGQVRPYSKPCLARAEIIGEVGAGRREEGMGEQGAGFDLVPVEVRLLSGDRVGKSVACLGPEKGGRGAGGEGGQEGSAGDEKSGGGAGGQEKGKESLVLVGIREVDVMEVMDFGGFSSVRLEGGGDGVGGVEVACGGRRAGRGTGSRRGGRGGRWVRSGAGVGPSFRDRSRSPGGGLRLEGAVMGGGGGPDGLGALGGGHEGAVEGVRGAVLGEAEGSGEGCDREGADSAGASASCG